MERKFKIFKFRTMVANADKIGTQVTVSNDSRVKKVGRKFGNIVLMNTTVAQYSTAGDMTLVGYPT